jgi:hypothetical protein
VLAGIGQWESRRLDSQRRGEALKGRVAAEIGPFLGRRATRRLLDPVSSGGENLLCTIEPVLAHFLGEKAASELVSHVVDAIVRT